MEGQDATENKLPVSAKRFHVDSEVAHQLEKTREVFESVKTEYPFLKGVGFFGSRVRGDHKPDSDLDIYLFYDSGQVKDFDNLGRDFVAIRDRISEATGVKVAHNETANKDINKITTDADIYKYTRFATALLNSGEPRNRVLEKISDMAEGRRLFTRFCLGVGDELYSNRAYVLNQFDGMRNGERLFGTLMDALAFYERQKKEPYYPMPQTIAEAREYFVLKPGN